MKLPSILDILLGHDSVRITPIAPDEFAKLPTWEVNCFCGKDYIVRANPEEKTHQEALRRGQAEHTASVIEALYDLDPISPEEDPDRQEPCVYCGLWKDQREQYGCIDHSTPHKYYSDHPDDTGPWNRIEDIPENRKVEGKGGVVFFRRSCFPQPGYDYFYIDGAPTSPDVCNNSAPFHIWGGWD